MADNHRGAVLAPTPGNGQQQAKQVQFRLIQKAVQLPFTLGHRQMGIWEAFTGCRSGSIAVNYPGMNIDLIA